MPATRPVGLLPVLVTLGAWLLCPVAARAAAAPAEPAAEESAPLGLSADDVRHHLGHVIDWYHRLGGLPPSTEWTARKREVNARIGAMLTLLMCLPEYQLT